MLLKHAAFNDMAWSISAEWFVYLGFPILAWVIGRAGWRSGAAVAAAAAAIYLTLSNGAYAAYGWHKLAGRALPEFIAGMLVYRLYADGWQRALWSLDAALLGTLAALGTALLFGARRAVIVALLLPLLYAGACSRGRLSRWFGRGVWLWLGEASYSVYLAQALTLSLARAVMASPLDAAVSRNVLRVAFIVATICVGALIYRCIDRPCRTYLRALGARLVEPSATVPAPVPVISERDPR